MKKFALVGNPNSGKTTLFNDLTGATAHVGNWPGVTVDKGEGVHPPPYSGTEFYKTKMCSMMNLGIGYGN